MTKLHNAGRVHARRRIAAAATGTALAAALAAPAVAATGSPAASPAARTPATAASKPAVMRARSAFSNALAYARAHHRRVVIGSLTTQTSQITANPAGNFTMTTSALPVRVRAGGSWRPVSAILRRNPGGSWSPAATPSALSLSGGGNGPMAVLTSPAGGRLALTFPVRLPVPHITGATATYRGVLPGVSLQLTATSQGGLTQNLIITTARAAASPAVRRLRLALSASGLRVTASAAGNVTATGPRGQAEFTSPPPVSTDTAKPAPARSTAAAVGSVPARAALSGQALVITAAASTLSPAARYPAMITSTVTPDATSTSTCAGPGDGGTACTSGQSGFVEAQGACGSTKNWNTEQGTSPYQGNAVGYDPYSGSCSGGADRSYYQFDVSNLTNLIGGVGNPIIQAAGQTTLNARETYGSDEGCSDTWPITLHLTDSISSSTDGASEPALGQYDQPSTEDVKSGANSSCSAVDLSFDVYYAMNRAVESDYSTLTFGFYGDETSSSNPSDGGSGACIGGDTSSGANGLSSAGYNCGFMRIGDNPTITTTFDIIPPVPTCKDSNTTATGAGATACNIQLTTPPQDSPGKTDFGCNGTTGWLDQTSDSFAVTPQAAIAGEKVAAEDHMFDNSETGAPEVTGFPVTSNYYPTSGSGTDNYTTSATSTGMPSAAIPLQNGHTYGWNAEAQVDGTDPGSGSTDTNGSAPYNSVRSADCYFTVDTSPPSGLTVSSTQFPASGSGKTSQDAGTAGTFTFSAADPVPTAGCTLTCSASGVYSFTYTLNGGAPQTVYPAAAASPGAAQTASISITPGDWGTNVLQVTAEDNAGNITATPAVYTFYAPWKSTTTVTAGDVNGDGIPDLLATTGSSLLLYSGNTDPGNTPVTAAPESGSPDSTAWNTYQITHRGSMSQGGVDDLFAHKADNLYVVLNNPSDPGAAPQYSTNTSSLTTILSHPACGATADNASNCSGYATGANWFDVAQILAPGDAWTGAPSDDGEPSLLTVENGQLWLYQGEGGRALGDPVQLGSSAGTTNWSGMTLIAPGTVGGNLTIWARDNTTGTLYSYPLTIDANGLPTLNPASTRTPVTATSGTPITGLTLTSTAYPAIASPGALDNSSYPGLYAETTTGTSPSGASCTSGCLYYYPGQSTTGGSSPLNTAPGYPLYVGTLNTPASQLS